MHEKMQRSVRRVISGHRAGFYRIVHCNRFKPGEEFLSLWLEHRSGVVRSRKPANRVERCKEVYDYEFGLFQSIAAKEIAAAITIDLAKSGKNRVDQQILVRIPILSFRPTSPMTSNHASMILRRAAM